MEEPFKEESLSHQSFEVISSPIEVPSEFPGGIIGELFDKSCDTFSIPVTLLPEKREEIINSINTILGCSNESNPPIFPEQESNLPIFPEQKYEEEEEDYEYVCLYEDDDNNNDIDDNNGEDNGYDNDEDNNEVNDENNDVNNKETHFIEDEQTINEKADFNRQFDLTKYKTSYDVLIGERILNEMRSGNPNPISYFNQFFIRAFDEAQDNELKIIFNIFELTYQKIPDTNPEYHTLTEKYIEFLTLFTNNIKLHEELEFPKKIQFYCRVMIFAFYYRHILTAYKMHQVKELWDIIADIFDENEDWVHNSIAEYQQDEDCIDTLRDEVGGFLDSFEEN